MDKKDNPTVEYRDKIEEINVEKIEFNELNPRKKFIESEEDELIQSIMEKGILNPIIVFKKTGGKYVILDGARRLKACLTLNWQTIPAHVLVREPNTLENLSMMFHIHNVREEWTDFAIALSLQKVIEELGKKIKKEFGKNLENLSPEDRKELSRITSLSDYKIKKYLKFLDYPNEVISDFLRSEKKEKPDKGYDPDILAEMHKPITNIKKYFPDLLHKHPVPEIIKACIDKKAANVIKNNREFRQLSKAFEAIKKDKIRPEVMKEKIIDFIKELNVTPEMVYADTAEAFYQFNSITKKINGLLEEIQNLNLRKLSNTEKAELKEQFEKLVTLIKTKPIK